MATIHHTVRRTPGRQQALTVPPERPRDVDERRLREEHILDAAADLLVRFGYRKATVDDVAREAGVGKGTIYLHWKDKNELFRAAIWREQQRLTEDIKQRIAADPDGGLLHRTTTHGILAILSSPLMAAMFTGKSDIFNGVLGAYDQSYMNQLMSDTSAWLAQLQDAGLIRRDLSASAVTYLITALKIGIIYLPDVIGGQYTPSIEELAEGMSDLIRRWLEPDILPSDSRTGKQSFGELLEKIKEPR